MPSMMKAPHSKGANCPMCDGGACKMAEGGEVESHYGKQAGGSANRAKAADRVRREDDQKGVHKSTDVYTPGSSRAGYSTRAAHETGDSVFTKNAKQAHKKVIGEMVAMPKPSSGRSGFAEGGDVESEGGEMDHDDELSHGLGKELMGAFESKDHKKLMSSLEACVLHCMSKGEDDAD